MKTKILITGSNGLVGQKTAALCANKPNIELLATSFSTNKQPNVSHCFKQLDITDKNKLIDTVKEFKPEVIINCAGMTQVDDCENNQALCWKANVESVQNLTAAANYINAKLIHFSTDFVFDGFAGNYAEEDLPNPVSFYGVSKWESEKIVARELTNYAIIRTVLVYGVTPLMTRSNIVLWVKESLEQNKPINVVDDQFRTPTLAEDLAEVAVRSGLSQARGIFHVSGGELMSVFEIAQRVARYFKLNEQLISPIASVSLNQTAKRPPKTGFNLYKANTQLSFNPTPFIDGLKIVEQQLKTAQEYL